MKVYIAAYPNMSAVVLAIHARLIARGHTPTASWPSAVTTVQQDGDELKASDVLVVLMRENAAPSPRATAAYNIGLSLVAGVVPLFSETAVLAAIASGTLRDLERAVDINGLEDIARAVHLLVQQAKVG